MKIRLCALSATLAFLVSLPCAEAQIAAKTLDGIQEINSDGSVNLTFQLAFDARPWELWKVNVGDDPARLRAMMRHQFSAYVIDDFKFEKDDLNRTAKITMRSPAGPELRKDLRFQIGVDGWCRLISHSDREWFFSGNNPSAGNNLNTIKIILPPNLIEASLVNAGTPDQALVYSLKTPMGKSRPLVIVGIVVMLAGAASLAAAFLRRKRPARPTGQPSSAGPIRTTT